MTLFLFQGILCIFGSGAETPRAASGRRVPSTARLHPRPQRHHHQVSCTHKHTLLQRHCVQFALQLKYSLDKVHYH